MYGYRKLAYAVLALLCSTLAVGMEWIEGTHYASIVTLVSAAFLGANALSKTTTTKKE